jgi:hypothetical protein
MKNFTEIFILIFLLFLFIEDVYNIQFSIMKKTEKILLENMNFYSIVQHQINLSSSNQNLTSNTSSKQYSVQNNNYQNNSYSGQNGGNSFNMPNNYQNNNNFNNNNNPNTMNYYNPYQQNYPMNNQYQQYPYNPNYPYYQNSPPNYPYPIQFDLMRKYKTIVLMTPSCNKDICNFPYGNCRNNQECECLMGYLDVNGHNSMNRVCGYQQKSRVFATLIETFFPVGLGHLYVGNLGSAVTKFFLFNLGYCLMLAGFALGSRNSGAACCGLCFLCINIIWYFIDIINFVTGVYYDGNGLPLSN